MRRKYYDPQWPQHRDVSYTNRQGYTVSFGRVLIPRGDWRG